MRGCLFAISRVIILIAVCALAPEAAHAESAIDVTVKPYFMLGGSLAALLFLALGAFLLGKAIRNRRMAGAAVQWPTTTGTVLSAGVVKQVSKSENGFDCYLPKVRYEYHANGIRRRGDIIRIGLDDRGYPDQTKAREHAALYPVGATVSVRYDPLSPDDAVLEVGQVGVIRRMIAGSIFVGIGIASIVFAIWSASLPTQ